MAINVKKPEVGERYQFSEAELIKDYGRFYINRDYMRRVHWHWDNTWKFVPRSEWQKAYWVIDRKDAEEFDVVSKLKEAVDAVHSIVETENDLRPEAERLNPKELNELFVKRYRYHARYRNLPENAVPAPFRNDLDNCCILQVEWFMQEICNSCKDPIGVQFGDRDGNVNLYEFDPKRRMFEKTLIQDRKADAMLSKRNPFIEDMKKSLERKITTYKKKEQIENGRYLNVSRNQYSH